MVRWDDDHVTFVLDCLDLLEPLVVVFVWTPGGFALGKIRGRGWCTPSGRVEPGESHLQAAIRETREETGIELQDARPLGCFRFTRADSSEQYIPAYLGTAESIGEPAGIDSAGAAIVSVKDLPTSYYRWDPLLSAVFNYARSVARR